ncbi:unnamed protein product [Rotaria sp. Silwood2]|nr:unnamed protein product [Rotaria sp. Silwood2]
MSGRTLATTSAPTPASGSAADMVSTCASPSGVFYNQAKHVRQIDVSTISGNMGILAYQAPVLSVLQPVSSGLVGVHPDSSIQLLAEKATPIENLDCKATRNALSEAQIEIDCA